MASLLIIPSCRKKNWFGSTPEREEDTHEVWRGSKIESKIAEQRERGVNHPHVLITDRDGTHSMWDWAFKGSKEELNEYQANTEKLNAYVAKKGIVMIMNTGGSIEMMEGGMQDGTIPADGAIVAGGGEFYVVKDGKYVRHEGYRSYIENDIGYKRDNVYEVGRQMLRNLSGAPTGTTLEFQARDSEANVAAWRAYEADPSPERKPKDIQAQQPYKISFHCSGGPEALKWTLQGLHERLADAGMEKLKIVHSADTYAEGQYHIDLLPIGKLEAAKKVINLLETEYGSVMAAVAGDAENDIDVVLDGGQAGIAVGNRQPSLEAAVTQAPASRVTKHFRIIQGSDGPRLVYSDPEPERKVGASLLHAVHALEIADRLIKKR